MRYFAPLLVVSLLISFNVSAEGTRELAPNGSIVVNGNNTTDLAALHINHPSYNNFAAYTNNDPHSRLYINIQDPTAECIYLGFSFGHLNVTSPNPTRIEYEYRIKDPAGNIVFGPVVIPTTMANIQNWSQAFTGPMQIAGAGGYAAHEVSSADLTSMGWVGSGNYYVEFQTVAGDDLLIDFWDITVADCSISPAAPKTGRIWSYNWSIFAVNDFGFPNRPFNGAFYVCAPDPEDEDAAFITKIDFNGSGFRPAAFNVAFNSFGIQNTGDIAEDRKSVQLLNATQSEYEIFLNDPVELCQTAIVGEIELLGISRCEAGEYCVKFTTTKEGQIELLLDFDGQDNIYTPGTRDVLLTHFVSADQVGIPSCIPWDGLDGLGDPIPEVAGTQIPIIISYAQGIYHFPIYDAEMMITGFMLEAVRPAASIPTLHYDDSNITVLSGSGEPPVQITGCPVPCHRWTNFVNNEVPGFGNLHTINSWWFSQRIVRQDVLFIPAYYSCSVDGPQSICAGSTTQINVTPEVNPSGLEAPEIISTVWTGPGIIGTAEGNTITIGSEGTYEVTVIWVSGIGDTCSTTCDYHLTIDPPLESSIDTLILQGDVININGQQYSSAGQYIQELTTQQGCDSILTINVVVINTVVYYDLDGCLAFASDGSNMDYSEFTAEYLQPLACADLSATFVFRDNPQMNKHSCTEGVNGSVAMCISSQDTCDYDPGHITSLVFELTVTPDPDTAVQITGLTFFEKGPLTYSWISGPSGPNNYPTLFGVRVLKNGTEIYRQEDIPTFINWTERMFSFLDEDEFIVDGPATFRFELLPYCLIGNGAEVAAWDVDDIQVQASCVSPSALNNVISGHIKTTSDHKVKDVILSLSNDPGFSEVIQTNTDPYGRYVFEDLAPGKPYHIQAYKNTGLLEGVSTQDLIFIQQHLLGKSVFTAADQFIAADANKSNMVTVLDLVALRQLILGKQAFLPNNTSWRFGNIDAASTHLYPWGFNETIYIESLQQSVADAHFTGIKIGDVNGSYRPNATGIITRTDHKLLLQVGKSSSASFELKAGTSESIAGLQLALYVPGDLKSIHSGSIEITPEMYHYSNGVLKISFVPDQTISMQEGEVLLTLEFHDVQAEEISLLTSGEFTSEAYAANDIAAIPIELRDAGVSSLQLSCMPNPFTDQVTLQFTMKERTEATLRIFDLSGKLIAEQGGIYDMGTHALIFETSEWNTSGGVLIGQISTGGFTATQKMILLK